MVYSNEEWTQLINKKVAEVKYHAETDTPGLQEIELSSDLIARTIDHTLLKPDATPAQIDQLCQQAIAHKFKSCCVNGTNVKQVARTLEGSSTIPCCVIGFPLGASTTATKSFEAKDAIQNGAKEIDMVMNIGALKSGDYALVFSDVSEVVQACDPSQVPVKVIIETAHLASDEEKIAASFISAEAGATFVKTCTGFSLAGGGATANDVILMKRTVLYKPGVMVKASAGIRTYEKCVEMLRAGADRIGTSSGVDIISHRGTGEEWNW